MRRIAGVAPALLLWACATAPPLQPPGPITQHDQQVFYDIDGRTAEELFEQIHRWGKAHGDSEMAALTNADFKANFQYRQEGKECRIFDVTLAVEIVTTLPRWQAPAGVGPDLERRWRDFEAALRVHERGHYDYALQEARALSSALKSVKVDDCKEMNKVAGEANDRVSRHYQDLNDEYDRKTGHGKTQGAIL